MRHARKTQLRAVTNLQVYTDQHGRIQDELCLIAKNEIEAFQFMVDDTQGGIDFGHKMPETLYSLVSRYI